MYGIITIDEQNRVTMHSDYASVVYYGQATLLLGSDNKSSTKIMYEGTGSRNISVEVPTANFARYTINISSKQVIPFFKPHHSGQKVSIFQLYLANGALYIDVLFDGAASDNPSIYIFCPLSVITENLSTGYGLNTYNTDGKLTFTTNKKRLAPVDVITITYPAVIREAAITQAGWADNAESTPTITSDTSVSIVGTYIADSNTIYSFVSSTYGGVGKSNKSEGTSCCKRVLKECVKKYAYAYTVSAWAHYHSAVSSQHGTSNYTVSYIAKNVGKVYQYSRGGCGWSISGLGGLLLAGVVFAATGGVGTALLVGVAASAYLAGHAFTSISTPYYDAPFIANSTNVDKMLVADISNYL